MTATSGLYGDARVYPDPHVGLSPYAAPYVRVLSYADARNMLRFPEYTNGQSMRQDAETLAAFLQPVTISEYASMAEQVFGGQARQQKLSLEHALNLLNERTKLHKRILDDINHRHMQVQQEKFGAYLHAKLDNHGRELKLERMLLQLDEQRRKEELEFWRDTVSLREQLFESAKEYKALRHRTSILEGLEPGGEDSK